MMSKMMLWRQAYGGRRLIVWGLELKSTGELIGIRYCEFYSFGIARLECKLSKRFWNQGYMTEASKAIIEYLELHDVIQFITAVNRKNIAAINLDKKLGFYECQKDELFLPKCLDFGDSFSQQGLMQLIQSPDEIVFVRPYINSQALKYYEEASNFKTNGDLKNTALFCEYALQLQPDFVNAIVGLAWALLDLGDAIGALKEFDKALQIRPNKYTALLGRGYAFSDLGKYKEGAEDLRAYLEFQPYDGETFVIFGDYLLKAGNYNEAIEAYDEAIDLNPHDEIARKSKQDAISFHRKLK